MAEKEEKKKDIKERLEKKLEEVNCSEKELTEEFDKLTVVKGEISGIRKELKRRKEMIEGEQELSEGILVEISDALEVLETEIAEKGRKTEEILKKDVEKKAEEYLANLKYLKADFENYKKRIEKEKEELADYAVESVLMKLLGIVDGLEMAAAHANVDADASKEALEERMENMEKGVNMVLKQFKEFLYEEGVEETKAEGEKFDPYKHEAVLKEVKEDCEPDTVIEVVRKGYSRKNKVMRPAMVKIAIKGDE